MSPNEKAKIETEPIKSEALSSIKRVIGKKYEDVVHGRDKAIEDGERE